MKKFLKMTFFVLLPIIFAESLLHINFIYMSVIENAYPVEWTKGFITPTAWPQILIMGSSWARSSIDPNLLGSELHTTIGDIAVPSDSLSNDYFTLYRILKTCKSCPNTIVFVVTDISLENHELDSWVDSSRERLKQNFIDDSLSNNIIAEVSRLDPAYKKDYAIIKLQKSFRLKFMEQDLSLILQRALSSLLNLKNVQNKPLMKTQISSDPGFGYYPYDIQVKDSYDEDAINNYRKYLGNYTIGGSGAFFFNAFLKLAKTNNVKLFFVLPPLMASYQNTFLKYNQEYRDYVISISEQEHMHVLNAINFCPNCYQLYSDVNHLNKFGAEKFTPVVSQYLKKFQD